MKRAARLVALAGAAGVGLFLFRAAPRDVALVYALPARGGPVTAIEVEIARGTETLRRAELRFPGGAPAQVRHPVKLTDGDYLVRLRLSGPEGPRAVERPISITESGTIVLPL